MSKQDKHFNIPWAWLVVLSAWCILGLLAHRTSTRRIEALEHDVEKLIEFMPMVVEREAGDE